MSGAENSLGAAALPPWRCWNGRIPAGKHLQICLWNKLNIGNLWQVPGIQSWSRGCNSANQRPWLCIPMPPGHGAGQWEVITKPGKSVQWPNNKSVCFAFGCIKNTHVYLLAGKHSKCRDELLNKLSGVVAQISMSSVTCTGSLAADFRAHHHLLKTVGAQHLPGFSRIFQPWQRDEYLRHGSIVQHSDLPEMSSSPKVVKGID